MNDERYQPEEESAVREPAPAYVTGPSLVTRISLDVPRLLWDRFTRWAAQQHLDADDALLQLIERQVAPAVEPPRGFYADLVGCHLRGELERKGSIVDIRVDKAVAEAIRDELCREYGTHDPVTIVEKMRDRQ